jgi:hypothetical protein
MLSVNVRAVSLNSGDSRESPAPLQCARVAEELFNRLLLS